MEKISRSRRSFSRHPFPPRRRHEASSRVRTCPKASAKPIGTNKFYNKGTFQGGDLRSLAKGLTLEPSLPVFRSSYVHA
eukprot:1153429-Pyramimonas_sp.AAC.1